MSEVNYTNVLQDVRQAWRIVAAYQQRVIHLLSSVEAYFPDLAQSFWDPASYRRPPSTGKSPAERWTWDGFPYYHTINWFTLIGTNSKSELKSGDWFLVMEIKADSGFDAEAVQHTASFNGPDPANMPPVEHTDSELHLYAYCVTGVPDDGISADDIWDADEDEGTDESPGKWVSLAGGSSKRLYWKKSLAELFQEGGETRFFADLKGYLREVGATFSER